MMNAGRKRKLLAWFAICLLVACAAMPQLSLADMKVNEGSGWDTPEDAVMQYLEGLKEQDLGKMISAYAIETYIDHFDLKAQLTRAAGYTNNAIPSMPNASSLLRDINIEARKNQIVRTILSQITSICLPGQDFFQPTPIPDGEAAKAFVDGIEGAYHAVNFDTLTFFRFVPPEQITELYASETNQENLKKQIAPYGAEEARSVIAVFFVGENICVLPCDAIRYEDRWFMHQPRGNIGALLGLDTSTGGIISVPQAELLNILGDLGQLDTPIQDILDDLLRSNFF